ncbi:hypothetical protein [Parerythrobacter aestuarii]|uniref:hypothetical protein n=1 Tax=Parerythrobacter aestuarii TaxID=3020909 RepID=UPI0024DE54DB|nr:hypothetical protein [Parerythrobacter aestuarii]
MYENTLEIPGRTDGQETGELRAIAWPELVARLAAQRDLRSVLLSRDSDGRASFNPCAAAMLTGRGDSKPNINRDALSHGKYPWANQVDAASGAAEGDRETT